MGESYEYVAYIDEAGEVGLNKVLPMDENGSSEWLVVSAVVISRENEGLTKPWLHELISLMGSPQMKDVHFRHLKQAQKALACSYLANKDVRIFSILSNKKNMKGWSNPFAEKVSMDAHWFYCWLTRLLLERVTRWVEWHSIKKFGRAQKVKIEFSESGGLSYSQMNGYWEVLKLRSQGGNMFLPLGDLRWSVIDRELLEVHTHVSRAGLRLPDIVASAFFTACDNQQTGPCDPKFAKLLHPKMARFEDSKDNPISGFGLKLMPKFSTAKLSKDQEEILRFFGYPKQWWDPALSNQRR